MSNIQFTAGIGSSFCFALADKASELKCSANPSYSSLRYEDQCVVSRQSTSIQTTLTRWMGTAINAIGELTLLDLSLPGTHDTLTNDLSLQASDGGADGLIIFAELLHNYSRIVPDGIEDWIRQQSQTQDLDIKQQLDNGVRFLDLRQMYEYTDEGTEVGKCTCSLKHKC